MIFVTYGTQPHNFEYLTYLVNHIDSKYHVVVQFGESINHLKREETLAFDYSPEYGSYVEASDIIITHGGVGSIMNALSKEKKVIVVPRLAEFEEHVDNHQLEVTDKLANEGYIYKMKRDQDINDILYIVEKKEFKKYESNTTHFVENIEKLLLGEEND